jgi:hypothetical protein
VKFTGWLVVVAGLASIVVGAAKTAGNWDGAIVGIICNGINRCISTILFNINKQSCRTFSRYPQYLGRRSVCRKQGSNKLWTIGHFQKGENTIHGATWNGQVRGRSGAIGTERHSGQGVAPSGRGIGSPRTGE